MNVTVFGLWHLGCVTAACTASAGNRVIGLDFDQQVVADLRAGSDVPTRRPRTARYLGNFPPAASPACQRIQLPPGAEVALESVRD